MTGMGIGHWLTTFRRRLGGKPPLPPPLIGPGARVRLRTPLASPHKVWIQAGAAGTVIGWDSPARQVSIELDTPRTVITVPWSWIEEEPDSPPPEPASPPAPAP
jgi:hypothetical protein